MTTLTGPQEPRCCVVGDLTLSSDQTAPNGWVMLRSLYPQSVYAGAGAGDGVTAVRVMPAAA